MAAGAAMQAAGGIVGGIGALQSGDAQQQAGNYNANIAFQNANEATAAGKIAVGQNERQSAMQISSEKAQYGANGVQLSGSPLDVLTQSVTQAALSSQLLSHKYAMKAFGYDTSGEMDLYQGDVAKNNSYYSAASDILTGAGNGIANLPAGGGLTPAGSSGSGYFDGEYQNGMGSQFSPAGAGAF